MEAVNFGSAFYNMHIIHLNRNYLQRWLEGLKAFEATAAVAAAAVEAM